MVQFVIMLLKAYQQVQQSYSCGMKQEDWSFSSAIAYMVKNRQNGVLQCQSKLGGIQHSWQSIGLKSLAEGTLVRIDSLVQQVFFSPSIGFYCTLLWCLCSSSIQLHAPLYVYIKNPKPCVQLHVSTSVYVKNPKPCVQLHVSTLKIPNPVYSCMCQR